MTNFERIKAMSVEEMAEFFTEKIMQQKSVLDVIEKYKCNSYFSG